MLLLTLGLCRNGVNAISLFASALIRASIWQITLQNLCLDFSFTDIEIFTDFVPPTYSPRYLEVARIYSVPSKLEETYIGDCSDLVRSDGQNIIAARAAKTVALWDVIVHDLFYNMVPVFDASNLLVH